MFDGKFFKFLPNRDIMGFKFNGVELEWLGHSSFRIKYAGKVIYIDPYQINSEEKADFIFITHSHYDHCSIADITNISKDGTTIICPPDCQSSITKVQKKINMQLIEPEDKIRISGIKIDAIPSYNNTKPFHPKSEGWVGYILSIENISIYHAGDTDLIKEMEKLTGYAKQGNKFIALLPIGGKVTMNIDEAIEAAKRINADIVIPMHYGSISGSKEDGKKFVELCKSNGINAEVLERI